LSLWHGGCTRKGHEEAKGFNKTENWRKKMKNFKNMVAAVLIASVLSVSSVFATDGIIIGSRDGIIIGSKAERTTKSGNPCSTKTGKSNSGIIIGSAIAGFTGIIIGSFTGIIIGSAVGTGNTNTNCGIIIGS